MNDTGPFKKLQHIPGWFLIVIRASKQDAIEPQKVISVVNLTSS